MTYYCDIAKDEDGKYVVSFPDMDNVLTFGFDEHHALVMAKEALEGVLETDLDYGLPIPEPHYIGGYAVDVSPNIARAICSRDGEAEETEEREDILEGACV